MKNRTSRMLPFALVCLVVLASGEVSASLHLSVGFGAALGGCHRHHAWCGDWPWHRYRHPYPCRHAHPCWPGCSSTVGVWLDGCPTVVAAAPVVVTERHVTLERRTAARMPARAENVDPPDEAVQRRRGELLKVLRIGGREGRARSARELAEHSCDARVRAALERALLSDREAGVRRAVAESLGKSGNEWPVSALRRAYERDADRTVRQAAYRAIIMIEGY